MINAALSSPTRKRKSLRNLGFCIATKKKKKNERCISPSRQIATDI
jgi:hypothetical protein